MRYRKFEIHDFKGIEQATVDLFPDGLGVYSLIGLNESGKTSVLEAIASFGITDTNVDVLVSGLDKPNTRLSYIPKSKRGNFTGSVKITAFVEFEFGEKDVLLDQFDTDHRCKLIRNTIPDIIRYSRLYEFVDSDFTKISNVIGLSVVDVVLEDSSDPERVGVGHDLWSPLTQAIHGRFPKIIYFPTFLFAFPDRILLNPGAAKEEAVNLLYRKVIEDVGGAMVTPVNIQTHIVDRLMSSNANGSINFPDNEKQAAVLSTLEQMSYHLTRTILSEWHQVLGIDVGDIEVVLRPFVDNSKPIRLIYLQFSIREKGSVFSISERSLGFRWFFSFLLFTHYRARAAIRGNSLFLLDEPASNLHPRAQTQLLTSFAKITQSGNTIIYSTHSHYMVEPAWLEHTFIVTNESSQDNEDEETDLVPRSPHVKVTKYRTFVGQSPDRITYLQPVLDNLDYAPSRIEVTRPTVLLEGKGDFFILEYVKRIIIGDSTPPFFVATRGATGMDELIGLLLGWGVPLCILLDDDQEGARARARYIDGWGLPPTRVATLGSVDASLQGCSIESILDTTDLSAINTHFGVVGTLNKSQIRLYFSEALAANRVIQISDIALGRITKIIDWAREACK